MANFGPDDIIGGNKFQGVPPEKIKQLAGRAVPAFIAVIALLTSFYTVDADSVGVVKRLGRYARTTDPGLHFKLPFNIETATAVPIRHVFKEEFGFRTLRAGVRTEYARGDFSGESLMLTGDLNNAVVEWVVQYRIRDARAYLFNVRRQRETIRDVSQVAMRQVIGDRSVNEVITTGRQELKGEVQKKLQAILNVYEMGVEILRVELQDVNPPNAVKASFNEVNQARQEQEKLINQAWEDYNKVIPRARGQAEKVIREAEGYATRRVNEAEGDANRFLATWEEYRKAKAITKKRLYLETLTEVFTQIKSKVIVDENQKGLLPFLNLTPEGGLK